MSKIKKIAYLFGAGATHAEILNLKDVPDELFIRKNGLLIKDVSVRVMKETRKVKGFRNHIEFVTSTEGSLNIELFLSLLELNRIPQTERKISKIKKLVQQDILTILSDTRKKKFYLHKALFELHTLIEDKEELNAIISLNYDDLLDDAYELINNSPPNYCHTSTKGADIPLLKLHGSFNWKNINTYGKKKDISIIPLGINKNYLFPPYNFVWGRAFEAIAQCDILRVIGCSLSQNDIGLIDLLFKAHLERTSELEIQIIDFENTGEYIKNNYGFLTGIVKPKDIEGSLIADEIIGGEPDLANPFKIWLKAKSKRLLDENIDHTKFIKKCFN